MQENKVLNLAAHAGKIILENGAETYRVEETMVKICTAFDIKDADSFVTPTGIMLSITCNNGEIVSAVRRVQSRTVNLEKISKINNLSRTIQKSRLSIDDVEKELKVIESDKSYSNLTMIFFAGIGAAFFTLIFGGGLTDFFVSLIIGFLIKYVSIVFSKINLNDFFVNIIGGSISALTALIFYKLGVIHSVDKSIIGSIMLLVPGLAITNAVRDTIAGDLVSGVTRGLEAFLTAVGIAVGTGIVFKIWIAFFGGINI
ncbi:threonine/serine exporter family protein [Clostridium guangxiense]|uniref:threonine/serine exporter family protein n=1 Tax=Clostridium guangxiense TaxID=1662055 RepID=UPI001E64685D|nr:threonine/serine exporter family protein [Clostridium guangxiense]MCD2345310.1 threonine/serine exporter family protein [Clostridium guangxiense]